MEKAEWDGPVIQGTSPELRRRTVCCAPLRGTLLRHGMNISCRKQPRISSTAGTVEEQCVGSFRGRPQTAELCKASPSAEPSARFAPCSRPRQPSGARTRGSGCTEQPHGETPRREPGLLRRMGLGPARGATGPQTDRQARSDARAPRSRLPQREGRMDPAPSQKLQLNFPLRPHSCCLKDISA